MRLDGNCRPEHYALTLRVDLEALSFQGGIKIQVKHAQEARTVRLHSVGLDIRSVHAGLGERRIEGRVLRTIEKAQMVELEFDENLPVGECTVELEFAAPLSSKMEGFYRAAYGNGRFMATTHFEPTDARRAFPCFDEPSFRAKFSIALEISADRSCVSCMPILSTVPAGPSSKLVQFDTTPSMPTYLVAFVVGDLEAVSGETNRGIPVEVVTRPGDAHLGSFALKTSTACLDFFEDFFGVEYPLPKMSLLAVPDFPIGAMENWGCITFRETAILSDEKRSSVSVRQRAGETICHEIAHMWFGNLVTVAWWEHLWLKEGFATWASMVAVDHIYPHWKEPLKFTCTSYLTALRLDSLPSTHAIEVPVVDPGQINEVFDTISYLKAASLIRMLADYVGLEEFRASLKRYLQRHQYGAATTIDLWRAIEEETKLPVQEMMGMWTKQPGYPWLNLTEQPTGDVTLSQQRFTTAGSTPAFQGGDTSLWMIPIRFTLASVPEAVQRALLRNSSGHLAAEGTAGSTMSAEPWYLCNVGRSGLFRVNYPQRIWTSLRDQLLSGVLQAADRAGMLSDAFALARNRQMPTVTALELLTGFGGETELAVWEGIVAVLYELKRVFCEGDEAAMRGWRAAVRYLIGPLGEKLLPGADCVDLSGDQDEIVQLRRVTMELMLAAQDATAIETAADLYSKVHEMPAELARPVLLHHVRSNGEQGYEDVLKMYYEASMNEFKVLCLSVLGGAPRTKELRLRTLQFSLTEVRAQDALAPISAVANSDDEGRELTWLWVQERWAEIFERFSGGSHVLPRLVGVATRFCDALKAQEVDRFFAAKDKSGFATALSMALEDIEVDAQWRAESLADARAWFTAR